MPSRRVALVAGSLLLAGNGLAGPSRRPARVYKADLSLIRPVTDEGYRQEPFRAPYVARFFSGRKSLSFVSAAHEDGVATPNGRTIALAIRRAAPQAVVVEGLTAGDATAEREWLRQAERFQNSLPERFPENYYAAYLAHRRGARVVGGEPGPSEVRAASDALGYSREDLVGLFMARSMVWWDKTEPIATHRRRADVYLAELAGSHGLGRPYSYAEFRRWFETRMPGVDPESLSGDQSAIGPFDRPESTWLQRFSGRLDPYRERVVVGQVERMLNAHDRVVIVYGSGHLVKQRRVWGALLGPSRDSKPY